MQCNVCVCRHVRMYVCDLRSGHSTQKCKLTLAEHSAPSDSHTRFWFKGHLPEKTSTVQKKKVVLFLSVGVRKIPPKKIGLTPSPPEGPPEVGQCCNHCGCPF